MIAVIVKNGIDINNTIASIKFSYYGNTLKEIDIIECDDWINGFRLAKDKGYQSALFLDSGTVVFNIVEFLDLIKTYPHKGLIAHLTDPLNQNKYFYFHEQCFYLDFKYFTDDHFNRYYETFIGAPCERSQQNIHHDYTPLMLRLTNGTNRIYERANYGEKLISQAIESTGVAVNWNDKMREKKMHLYNQENIKKWNDYNNEYFNVAEQQFWIINNEEWNVVDCEELTTPASGLFWIFNILQPNQTQINLVDISQVQINFAKYLWNNWDGNNYGAAAFDFLKDNNIQHYNTGESVLCDPMQSIKLKKRAYFEDYINKKFLIELQKNNIEDFSKQWNHAKKNKTVTFNNKNLVDWILSNNITGKVWYSNVDNYKYTLLKNSREQLNDFKRKINEINN